MTKCNTPNTMLVNICKSCKRVTKEKGGDIATFAPNKHLKIGWVCGKHLKIANHDHPANLNEVVR